MHHRRSGYPFGSLVDFATDGSGHPIFSLSPLAIHTRNVVTDPRVSMVVQMPGWGGLANARVTIFGDVYPLPAGMQAAAREVFRSKFSAGGAGGSGGGNFTYFRMNHISDIYFVGGFGTVQWVDVGDYRAALPDPIVTRTATSSPESTLAELNAQYGRLLPCLLDGAAAAGKKARGAPAEEAILVSIDRAGLDARVLRGGTINVERLRFLGQARRATPRRGARASRGGWGVWGGVATTLAGAGIVRRWTPRRRRTSSCGSCLRCTTASSDERVVACQRGGLAETLAFSIAHSHLSHPHIRTLLRDAEGEGGQGTSAC